MKKTKIVIAGLLLTGLISAGCGKGSESTGATNTAGGSKTEYEGTGYTVTTVEEKEKVSSYDTTTVTEKETQAAENTATATEAEPPSTENTEKNAGQVDYMILVNKEHAMPENWTDIIELKKTRDVDGDTVQVESTTYKAYLILRDALAAEGIDIQIGSAYRSIEEQQGLVDYYMREKGEDYVKQYVAVPGYSEHNTGLAIDLCIPGAPISDEALFNKTWARVHSVLADYGFILRYPLGKSDVTGYSYEYWHIRYIGNIAIAKDIAQKGITLEEYLSNSF